MATAVAKQSNLFCCSQLVGGAQRYPHPMRPTRVGPAGSKRSSSRAKVAATTTAAPSIEVLEADAVEQLTSFTAFDLDEFVAGKSKKWTFWNCEPSEFPWSYHQTEYAYVLQGQFFVTYEGGEPAEIKAGDFVKFPPGETQFKVVKSVKKFFTLVDE